MAEKDVDRVWRLMTKLPIGMLAAWDGEELRARPMALLPRRNENAVYFLSDARHGSDSAIREHPRVCIALSDIGAQEFVSIAGAAEVLNDREKIQELWSSFASAYWKSADDPNVRVIKVTPHDAEFWDGVGGTVTSYVKMLAATVTGRRRPDMGDHKKVAM